MIEDWLHLRSSLANHPAVTELATALGLDRDTMLGKLVRLRFVLQSLPANQCTAATLDHQLQLIGLVGALVGAGWCVVQNGSVCFHGLGETTERKLQQDERRRARQRSYVARKRNPAKLEVKPKASEVKVEKAVFAMPACLDTEAFRVVWDDWERHRREKRQSLTPTTRKRQLAKLAKIGEAKAIACINASIDNGWQGLFPERFEGSGNGRQQANGKGGRLNSEPGKYRSLENHGIHPAYEPDSDVDGKARSSEQRDLFDEQDAGGFDDPPESP